MKIREQKPWKSKRNGGKERMNPQEKALKSKHQLKLSVTIKQVTTERRMVKVRGLSGRNEKLTNKRANRHMSTSSIILARKMRESNGKIR